jgi:putative endonuclease
MITKYYVYALQSLKDKQLYIGMTNDVKRRLCEHNSGHTRSTKHRIPFRLIYEEECRNRQEARDKERN